MTQEPTQAQKERQYQKEWWGFKDKLRQALGLRKAEIVEKDPFNLIHVLPYESKETVEAVMLEAEKVRDRFPVRSKWWLASGIVLMCSTTALGLIIAREHFQKKEKDEH